MFNRILAPEFQPIKKLALLSPEEHVSKDGLKTFVFHSSDIELVKFEFVFNNIQLEGKKPLVNAVLSAMLKEGTVNRTSAMIANEVDFYGAYLMSEYSYDHSSLVLYTMRKHATKLLPIVADIFQNANFPEQELVTHIKNNKQSLQISLKKNDVLARRLFYSHVFEGHRYGTLASEADYNAITQEDLITLYNKQIQPTNCTLFISGNVDFDVQNQLDLLFVDKKLVDLDAVNDTISSFDGESVAPKIIFENREEALQSAVRIGGVMIRRDHKDYPALQFVNTLFGGFFGSRLMRNIREEKGYTYSIGSSCMSMKEAGFMTLATEVGVDVTNATLDEIALEFNKLRQDKTSDEEVSLVRNYMQGVLLGSIESIFSHAEKFKSVYLSKLDLAYYDYYSNVIANITADQVQDIAIKYFDYDRFFKVIVGKSG